MKRILILALLVAPPAFAQSKTALETGLSKTGATVVKTVHPLDPIDPSEGPGIATISAIALSNPKDAAWKPKGLSIAIDDSSDRPDSVSTAYVDSDEIDGLVGGLDWMLKSMGDWEGKDEQPAADVTFTTKGGFVAGFGFTDGKARGYARVGNSKVLLDKDGLATLRGMLVLGRDHLKSIK